MAWVVAITIVAAAVMFVLLRAVRGPSDAADDARLPEMSVTLSVLPTRMARVVLDVGPDAPSAAMSRLVEQAVRDAFVFNAVEVVEVRRRTGELLELRRRDGVLSA